MPTRSKRWKSRGALRIAARAGLWGLGASLAIAAPCPARAEGPRSLVVITAVNPKETESLTALALRAAIEEVVDHHLGIEPLEPDGAVEGAQESLRRCGSEVGCMAARLAQSGADQGLVVAVSLDAALLSLTLIDARAGGRAPAVRTRDLDGVEAAAVLVLASREAAALLEAASFPPAARVAVDVRPAGARLSLPSTPLAEHARGGAFRVPPGRHFVHAEADGHQPADAEVIAIAGGDLTVALVLEPTESLLASPWTWAIAAAFVAGSAAAVVWTVEPAGCICFHQNGAPCRGCH
jgi:hypothetical protein